ncbi:hypothetical protein R6Q59_011777 [Mikania micrantha]|uniref:Uncharacterized protein n=1 Tax=Mikania micrantha TaxID=192012 RepID=A0A5N6LKA7_9ASTR|nr:hypothetical protein E3N88_41544 [Mikania micrantha]KAD4384235.1 hypothetical protein E3N88_24403 [Mikania micrantha]
MPMDRSSSWGSQSGSENSSSGSSRFRSGNTVVLSVECLKGSSKAEEWAGDMLQTGDIVEEIRIGNLSMTSPFKNGKNGVQKILHNSFKSKETSIRVRIRRGSDEFAELMACIVPNTGGTGGRKQYMLRSIDDPNYTVGFVDRTEADCLALQASRNSRMVSALAAAKLHDGYVAYPWHKKMQELLSIPNSSCFLSILFLPKASETVAYRYNDLEDTLSRANAWHTACQASGVPVVFMNIQTESLLTKISGETASSTVNAGSLSDLMNLANVSLYGFEDYHGVDIGVVRAVRLWYAPIGGEVPVEIKIKEGDEKLGFAIGRTAEGFIHVTSIIDQDEDSPSTRSGLSSLYMEAKKARKKLIISRISNQKVLPWMVSPEGAIRCYDTVSLSQKLSLHRHTKLPISLHVFAWDQEVAMLGNANLRTQTNPPAALHLPPDTQTANQVAQFDTGSLNPEPELRLVRDTAGEDSFRFHNFSLPNNWV